MFFFFFFFEQIQEVIKEIFEYLSYNIVEEEPKDTDKFYNMLVEKQENRYSVIIKNKMTNNQLSKLVNINHEEIAKTYKPLLIVLDDIKGESKQILKQKYNIEILDISNIIYLIHDNEELMNKLRGIIDYSLSGIEGSKPDIEFKKKQIGGNIKKDAKYYIDNLKSIKTGREECYKYQEFCENLIKDMYSDDLDSWSRQNRTEQNNYIFDLIARIKYRKKEEYNDFFNMIENILNSKYLLFEFKNYEGKIEREDIRQVEAYLYEKALRKVAIILTRNGSSSNADDEIRKKLKEQGKTIIVLDDNDVIDMIKIWKSDSENNSSIVFQEKLNNLYIHLEQ